MFLFVRERDREGGLLGRSREREREREIIIFFEDDQKFFFQDTKIDAFVFFALF